MKLRRSFQMRRNSQQLASGNDGAIKFAALKYDSAANLGDEIQTLAVQQLFPGFEQKLDRDRLGEISSADIHVVIMNGWFSYQGPNFFPPSSSVFPVFFGFHMTEHNNGARNFLTSENIEYFKQHEPIGCRDKRTMQLLQEKGVEAFYSKCLTLTFPKRTTFPDEGRVFVVDADHVPIPDSLHRKSVFVSQDTYPFYGDEVKSLMARELLETYREQAALVITTRLHCALPCIAMGIPVIFFGDSNNTRISLVKDLGLEIVRLPPNNLGRLYRAFRHTWVGKLIRNLFRPLFYRGANWTPAALDIEKEKLQIKQALGSLLELNGIPSSLEFSGVDTRPLVT